MNTVTKEPLKYINADGFLLGTATDLDATKHARKKVKAEGANEWHKGFRVQGIKPGALEDAEKEHPRLIADAVSWNERVASGKITGKAKPVPGPWDPAKWLNEAKRWPVRSKGYEVPEAAQECKALAEKSGWLRVEVVELKKAKNA